MNSNSDLINSFKTQFLSAKPKAAQPMAEPASMDITEMPDYRTIQKMEEVYGREGMLNPYFMPRSGAMADKITVHGKEYICYSGYNYLGLSHDPRVVAAAQDALQRYGTHAGAARMVGGELELHQELEKTLSQMIGAEDCVVTVGGYTTNVMTIGYLMGAKDLVIMDEYMHNSGVMGAVMSGCRRMVFPHNDLTALEKLLRENRDRYEKVMVVVEGAYSMDGDLVDLPRLINLKKRYNCWLMVDEAHSLGVLGASGRGVCEHWGVAASEVDIIMGTLSKSFASCGGFLAGSREMIKLLRIFAPGVLLYSTGLPPASAAAANAAVKLMLEEPERVHKLQENGRLFSTLAAARGFNVGDSGSTAVVPVMLGDSTLALNLMSSLLEEGIIAHAVLYPVVPNEQARLRFFITSEHSREEFEHTLDTLQRIFVKAGGKLTAGSEI